PELASAVEELVPLARDARPFGADPDELPRRALLHALERRAPDPVTLLGVERHAEREARLDRIVARVDLAPLQRHAVLDAQRVARAEPDRPHAARLPGPGDRLPHAPRLAARDVDLEPVLARVAGPRDARPREAAERAETEAVVADRGEIEVGDERLE